MIRNNNNLITKTLITSLVFSFVGTLSVFAAGPATVNLLTAGNFEILAKTGISTTGTTLVIGDIGVSPAAATYITGFALNLTAASAYATTPQVVGKVYAPGYADPTPAYMTTAISDMEAAYTDAAGRTNPTATELGAGNIGGLTIAPGLYKWGTGVTIPSDVTLSGNSNDVWIFQIAQNLDISSSVKVILAGGAKANNVFWIVAGQTTISTNATFNGNILDQTAIVLKTGAVLNGRALAQTAVTLDSASVNFPENIISPATPAIPALPTISPAIPAIPTVTSYGNSSGYNYSVPTPVLTSEQQKQYNQLISVGVNSTAALNAVSKVLNKISTSSPSSSAFGQQVKMIAISLGQGGRGNNVSVLQQFLISQDKGPAAKALAKAGATSYFGSVTRAALAEFQAKVGISPALGNFGSITRAYISSNY